MSTLISPYIQINGHASVVFSLFTHNCYRNCCVLVRLQTTIFLNKHRLQPWLDYDKWFKLYRYCVFEQSYWNKVLYWTNFRMSNVAYKHFTSKTPRCQQYVCPVCSPMQRRHKQSRGCWTKTGFLLIWWKKCENHRNVNRCRGTCLSSNIRKEYYRRKVKTPDLCFESTYRLLLMSFQVIKTSGNRRC